MIVDVALLTFAVSVILAAGMAVFYGVVREPQRYFRLERIAYCWPLGLAAVGMPIFLLSLAGVKPSVPVITGLVLAAVVASRFIRRISLRNYWCTPPDLNVPQSKLTEFEWSLVFIIVACLAARTVACLLTPMVDWDGVCTWGIKAKLLYHAPLKDTLDYFRKAEYRCTNQAYPLLVPFIYSWMCTVLGRWDDLRMFIVNPINFCVFMSLLYFTLRKIVSRTSALAVTAIAASLPASLHYAECAQSDVPLMLLSGAGTFCLLEWMRERRLPPLVLAGMLMGGAMFCKEEGRGVFAAQLCAAGLFLLLQNDRRAFKHIGIFALVGTAWILPWLLFRRTIPGWEQYFHPIGLHTLRWSEIGAFMRIIWDNALHFYNGAGLPKWNFLWPILFLMVLLSRASRQTPWNCVTLIPILHAGALIVVWLCSTLDFTPGNNEFAYERNVLGLLPPLWIILAKCVDEWWILWKSAR